MTPLQQALGGILKCKINEELAKEESTRDFSVITKQMDSLHNQNKITIDQYDELEKLIPVSNS